MVSGHNLVNKMRTWYVGRTYNSLKETHETSSFWLKGESMMKKQRKPGHQKRCPTLIIGRSKYNTNRYCLCCEEMTLFQYIVQYGHSRCSKCGGGYAQRTKEGKKDGNDDKSKL